MNYPEPLLEFPRFIVISGLDVSFGELGFCSVLAWIITGRKYSCLLSDVTDDYSYVMSDELYLILGELSSLDLWRSLLLLFRCLIFVTGN